MMMWRELIRKICFVHRIPSWDKSPLLLSQLLVISSISSPHDHWSPSFSRSLYNICLLGGKISTHPHNFFKDHGNSFYQPSTNKGFWFFAISNPPNNIVFESLKESDTCIKTMGCYQATSSNNNLEQNSFYPISFFSKFKKSLVPIHKQNIWGGCN